MKTKVISRKKHKQPFYVLAVDLGGTKCSAAIIDKEGHIISSKTVPVDLASSSAPVVQICQLAKELAGLKSSKEMFAAAAVAVPGLVRPSGTVWAPNLPGWDHMPLANKLKRPLGIPVMVESDRNAAVLGESWRGAARRKSDVIMLMIGTGIGAGIMSGGRLVRGAHELSGCAGWMAVAGPNNPQSKRVGELESLIAGPAIARIAQERIREGCTNTLAQQDVSKITAHDVAVSARRGDQMAIAIFHEMGQTLGLGIANLVSLFDPEIIVIGGGMAATSDLYLARMKQVMTEHAQPIAAKQVKIAVSKLGDKVNLLGCARIAWETANQ